MSSTLLLLSVLLLSSSCFVSSTRMIGYWSLANGYANQTGCAPVLTPDRIPANLYTHMIYSFAFINSDFDVDEPTPEQLDLMQQVQNMKLRNPNLKTVISLGGWSMNMSLYSNGVATPTSRATLVQNVMTYLRKYNWDGVDFDWEYPADPTRGGTPQDPANFALFIQQMRAAVEAETIPAGKSKLELSIPLPGGVFHGQNYIMSSMIQNLDYANIMAYNLHGPWEPVAYCSANFYDGTPADSPYHGYSISDAITYFLNQNGSTLPASKFNLGVTFAGVEFTLQDGNSFAPGAATVGEGNGGACTKEPGYEAYFEVESLLATGSYTPQFDPVGYCKYFVHDNNQWVGYDDAETLAAKVALVEKLGLGGISVWAMYAESASGSVLQTAIANALFPSGQPTFDDESSSTSSAAFLAVNFSSILLIFSTLLCYVL